MVVRCSYYLLANIGVDTAENEPSENCGSGSWYVCLKWWVKSDLHNGAGSCTKWSSVGRFRSWVSDAARSEAGRFTEERKGEEGCSEYDPSTITTEKYELEDKTDLQEIIEIEDVTNLSQEENKKLFEFFEHLLWENIILIYVDVVKKTIRQIYEDDAEEGFIENQTEIVLFAREYDHVEDY